MSRGLGDVYKRQHTHTQNWREADIRKADILGSRRNIQSFSDSCAHAWRLHINVFRFYIHETIIQWTWHEQTYQESGQITLSKARLYSTSEPDESRTPVEYVFNLIPWTRQQFVTSQWCSLYFYFFHLHCANGIIPMGNLGCFPRGWPAATESSYPTYCACWVF